MASHTLVYTLLLVLLNFASVFALNPPQYCFYGCNSATYEITFKGSPNIRVNELAYKTNYYCAAVYCSNAEIDAGLSQFNRDCEYAPLSFHGVVGSSNLDGAPRLSLDESAATVKVPLDHVVIPD